jgi:hypothetical protein
VRNLRRAPSIKKRARNDTFPMRDQKVSSSPKNCNKDMRSELDDNNKCNSDSIRKLISTLREEYPKRLEPRRSGKKKLKTDVYRAKVLQKLDELKTNMEAIGDKTDEEWKKLRK